MTCSTTWLVVEQVLQNTMYFAFSKEVVKKLKFPNNSMCEQTVRLLAAVLSVLNKSVSYEA